MICERIKSSPGYPHSLKQRKELVKTYNKNVDKAGAWYYNERVIKRIISIQKTESKEDLYYENCSCSRKILQTLSWILVLGKKPKSVWIPVIVQ